MAPIEEVGSKPVPRFAVWEDTRRGGRMHGGEMHGEGGVECMEARCMERGVGRGFEKDCDNPLSFLHPLLDNVCVDRHGNAVIVSCFSR